MARVDLSLELPMSHDTTTDRPHTSLDDLAPTKRRLTEQLERSEDQILELELVVGDPDTIQEDRDSARSVLDSIRADVFQIRRALARIESGNYGRCVTCGCLIADERLQMIPFVAHCTSCA
jgi:DnaK suppressor protein